MQSSETKRTKGRQWTQPELFIAMNIYCKLPFGKFHQKNPLIIEVASKLGRSPASLAMKLCNLASLDSTHRNRGIRGLQAASRLDRTVWNEFMSDWNETAIESEKMYRNLMEVESSNDLTIPPGDPCAATEKESVIRTRIGQSFFRQTILSSYGFRCCLSGNPVPELLIASHIAPWSKYPSERLNPRNGLCLSSIHDSAFDKGLIAFDENNRLMISKYLEDYLPGESIQYNFVIYLGKELSLPDKFDPDRKLLQIHRNEIFRQ